ncbi:MAG TPA: hypothetical protein VMZ51_03255 [Acidimicrobiales bacterium]|nr:hypothetical protein [Acidimicrobiales bacterium]
MTNRFIVALASVALLGSLVSCSDDDEPKAGNGDGSPAPSRSELRQYCGKVLQAETFAFPQIADLPEADRPGRLVEYARELRRLVDEAAGAAPTATKADLRKVAVALDEVVKTNGDLARRGTPAVRAASARAHTFELANCGWRRVDTTAVEFTFQGFPETIPAGVVSFELANKGEFDHVLELYRVEQETVSGRETLSRGDLRKEDLAKFRDVGSAFAREGEQGHVVRALQPGRYVAACLIALNSTPPATHASKGMLAEFTVT